MPLSGVVPQEQALIEVEPLRPATGFTRDEASAGFATSTLLLRAVAIETGEPPVGVAATIETQGRTLVAYEDAKQRLTDDKGELLCVVPAEEALHIEAWGIGGSAGLVIAEVTSGQGGRS